MQNKKGQHYVWANYLDAWESNSSKVHWYKKSINIFKLTLPEKIAKEKYFYKLNELTSKDIQALNTMYVEGQHPIVQTLNTGWIQSFTSIFDRIKIAKTHKNFDEKSKEELSIFINNAEENLHTAIEHSAIPYLESLKDNQITFNTNENDAMTFLIYLATQYFRTKRMRNVVIASTKEIGESLGIDTEKTWNVSSHMITTIVSFTLLNHKPKYKWTLLSTSGNVPFITTDQPVINTRADYSSSDLPEKFELYYPISPTKALLFSPEKYIDEPENVEIDETEVQIYNELMVRAADDLIFSNDLLYLKQLLGFPDTIEN